MSLDQKTARAFGVLYLITFATSIPALALYESVLRHPVSYIAGAGHDKQVLLGAFLELLLIVANIGTAVVIFPIVRRQSEELALGYVAARILESTFILLGIAAMVAIVTLRQQVAGGAEGTVAYTLAAIKDWTFLLGPGWVVGLGNGLILGYLMYRSELVPRRMCWFGLIGGALLIITGTAILFGGNNPSSGMHSLQAIATIPSSTGSSSSASTAPSGAFGVSRRSSRRAGRCPSRPRSSCRPDTFRGRGGVPPLLPLRARAGGRSRAAARCRRTACGTRPLPSTRARARRPPPPACACHTPPGGLRR